MVVQIAATPQPDAASVRLDLTGGDPGDTLYVFRRDTGGVGVVRDTSAGTITWPAQGPLLFTNLIPNGGFLDGDPVADGDLTVGADLSATTTTEHALPAAWAVELVWTEPGQQPYPSSTLYPSATLYPTTGA